MTLVINQSKLLNPIGIKISVVDTDQIRILSDQTLLAGSRNEFGQKKLHRQTENNRQFFNKMLNLKNIKFYKKTKISS
jgi:hypothetical protein